MSCDDLEPTSCGGIGLETHQEKGDRDGFSSLSLVSAWFITLGCMTDHPTSPVKSSFLPVPAPFLGLSKQS